MTTPKDPPSEVELKEAYLRYFRAEQAIGIAKRELHESKLAYHDLVVRLEAAAETGAPAKRGSLSDDNA